MKKYGLAVWATDGVIETGFYLSQELDSAWSALSCFVQKLPFLIFCPNQFHPSFLERPVNFVGPLIHRCFFTLVEQGPCRNRVASENGRPSAVLG
jgi:hypothetical protein